MIQSLREGDHKPGSFLEYVGLSEEEFILSQLDISVALKLIYQRFVKETLLLFNSWMRGDERSAEAKDHWPLGNNLR